MNRGRGWFKRYDLLCACLAENLIQWSNHSRRLLTTRSDRSKTAVMNFVHGFQVSRVGIAASRARASREVTLCLVGTWSGACQATSQSAGGGKKHTYMQVYLVYINFCRHYPRACDPGWRQASQAYPKCSQKYFTFIPKYIISPHTRLLIEYYAIPPPRAAHYLLSQKMYKKTRHLLVAAVHGRSRYITSIVSLQISTSPFPRGETM